MDTIFVAREDDQLASVSLGVIASAGHRVRLLSDEEEAPKGSVALFTINATTTELNFPSRYLRIASHRMNGVVPIWAKTTPFVVAIKDRQQQSHSDFRKALLALARDYKSWFPGQHGVLAPWHPDSSNPAPGHQGEFEEWLERVYQVGQKTSLKDILHTRLEFLFGQEVVSPAEPFLVVLGCAPFNRAHTDIAASLLETKMVAVRSFLISLIKDSSPWIKKVVFPIVAEDFLTSVPLRASLHPFMWSGIKEIESMLGSSFEDRDQLRLDNKMEKRTDDEVAQSLRFGYDLLVEELVTPIIQKVGVEIQVVNWTTFFGSLLDSGWGIAMNNREIAQNIYQERVKQREWYRRLDESLGKDAGLMRTLGNNAAYIATAMWAEKNPQGVIVDFEVDDQFWRALEPVVDEISNTKPLIAFVAQGLRQPWSY